MTPFSSRSASIASAGLVAVALAVAAFLLLVVQGGRSGASQEPEEPAYAKGLTVVPVEVREEPGYAVRERYVGRAVSRRSSRLGFTQGGLLVQVLVDEGDAVEEGALLARLDTARLEAARRELEAQVTETEARLALSRLNLNRARTLAGKDTVSKQVYDEARFGEMALAARLASARAGVERVEVDLRHAELRAPFAGRVVARSTDEGTILAPGQSVLQLIEGGPMEVRVGVPPEVAALLVLGSRHTVELDGESVQGELVAVLDEVAADTRTVTAVFLLEERDTPIRHGALARLVLATRRDAPGFWLPITALTESRRGLWAAFAAVPEPGATGWHRVERRELSLLHVESDRAFVRGTLVDGDRLVAAGVHRLVPGQRVRLSTTTQLAQAAAR